ncbi:MAG: ABC transporter ATP-binding protein [Candidatus Njordarchaeum guaymaensis]
MNKILEIKNISKRFGNIQALRDVSFDVEKGEFVFIVAHTNAGKSTLLKIIAGILEPDEGEIYIEGENITKTPPWERPVGYMPQTYALFPHMTVLENVMFGPIHRGLDREEAIEKAQKYIELVGLKDWEKAYPHELSGGMQQRVALARVLAVEPKIILLDEPLSALDALLRVRLRGEIKKILKGKTVLWVTHDQEGAMSLADKLIVMRSGRIVAVGNAMELYYKPPSLYVAHFLGEINFIESVAHGGFVQILDTKVSTDKIGPVVIGIRPEDIKIVKNNSSPLGRVKELRFVSGFWRLLVDVEGIDLVVYSLKRIRSKEVSLRIRPEDVLVFDYPPEGIRRAVHLE